MNYRKNTKPETKWASWKRLFSSLTVVALAASASYANAADVTSETELKAAISAGDTNITIPANTVITLTSALPEIGYNTVISGAADGSSVIDGASSYTAFSIASNATVTIKGLTIQNTYLALVDLAGTQKGGAAIYNQGTLTVEECHFANNKVDGSVAVAARGGAVYSTGTLNLLYSSFFSNMSEGGDTITDGAGRPVSLSTVGRGGALYIENQGTVQNCTFSGNTAKGGDGHGKDPDIAGGAGAHAYGGAIAVAANATVLVDFVTMVDNQAQGGNTELSEGGGVTGAGEGHGGAIYTASSTLTVRNTIFINSRQSTGVVTASSEPDIDGNFIDGGGNLFNSPTTSVEAVQKASNGTFVYPINKTSPAYNQAAAVDTVTRDQRNVARPRPNAMEGTGYDIGAYQLGVWTVVADDKTRPYNTENPELTYYILDPDGEVVTSTISGMPDLNTTAVITSPVGDYPITVTQGTLDPALDYIYQDGTLTITSVALTVTAEDKSRLYNTPNPTLTYIITDAAGEVVSVSGTAEIGTDAVISSPIGEYPIVVTQGTLDPNYTYTFVDGTLTINPAPLTVTADNKTRPYNTENPTLTYVITDPTGAVVSVGGEAAISTTAVISSPVGDYPITVTQGSLDSNYTYTFVPGTLTITPASLIVTADDKTRPYNTENPALTYVITDASGAVVSVTGEAAISTTAVKESPVGDYPITVTQGTLDSNYTYTFVNGTLTITPVALTVTADDKTRPYNTENPALTYVITDGSGTVVSVTGEAAISTTAVKESPVGDYPITVAQGTLDSNYTYTFVPGTLTITPASLIVTAEDKTRPYNTDNPALTYVITDGSGAVVTVPGTPALSTTAVKESPVGEYPITVTKGSLSDNYTYTFVNGTLTITPVALTVTADDKTRPYNTENPALTYKITDGSGAAVTVPGTPAISTTAVKESPVGEYPITIAQGTLDSNYTYTFVNGTLTITPVALTVKADDKTRPYNTENPELTYVITDASGAVVTVTGTPALSTTAVKASPVGDYPITVAQGTLSANYTYTFINGTLKVTPVALTVKADDKTRPYNTENPELTYKITDASGAAVTVTGTPALSTTAVKESPVGEYPITVAQGTLDSNYTYTFINGTLTITAIDVRVALPGCERLYGQRNIDATNDFTGGLITMTVEDLLFYYDGTWHPYADVKSSVEGAPVFYTLGYDYKGKVGNYAVKVYPGSFKGKNMNFELLPTGELCSNEANSADPLTAHLGDYLRILPVDLHITAYADPAVVVSGETPTYKYYYGITNEVTGEVHGYFVNNETEADLISKPRARLTDLFVDITVDGIYTITPYGAQSENYNIIRHDGQFAVYGSKPSMEEGPLPRNYDMDGGEFNPYQIKGLYEQLVLVKNTTSETWTGIELYASNVQGGTVVNALNYSNGAYRMLHNYAVAPDEIVAFVVKFNIPSGNSLKDYPTYNYVPLYAGINDKTEERVCATGDAVQVENFAVVDVPTYNTEDWTFDTADAAPCALKYLERYGWAAWVNVGTYLKISNLTKGSVYEIQYSADGTNWTPVLPNFVATDTTYEWTDKGAPETEAHPLVGHQTTNLRLYRVIKVK